MVEERDGRRDRRPCREAPSADREDDAIGVLLEERQERRLDRVDRSGFGAMGVPSLSGRPRRGHTEIVGHRRTWIPVP
jgi:hypothetical protein